MNKVIMTMICIIVVIGAMITAVAIYKPKKEEIPKEITTKVAEENTLPENVRQNKTSNEDVIETNSEQEKVLPHASIIFKTTYLKCGHTTDKYEEVPDSLVNKTKEEIKKIYPQYDIEEFSDTQLVLKQTKKGSCGEHYDAKEKDGKIVIYEILEDGTEKEYLVTDIVTEYLTKTDKENIQNGVKIYGKQKLNQFIEDFE